MNKENNEKKYIKKIKEGDFAFLLNKENFEQLIGFANTQNILYHYFSENQQVNQQFERRLVLESPKLFVKAVQTNQYFLRADRIEFLLSLPLPKELKADQGIWKYLQFAELSLWSRVESQLSMLKELPLKAVLAHLVLWIEERRFVKNDKEEASILANIYSSFIAIYFANYSKKDQNAIDSDEFARIFYGNLVRENANPLAPFLSAIDEWLNFRDSILAEYCFDENSTPKVVNGIVHLFRDKKAVYNWKLDETRYELNRLNYMLLFQEQVWLQEEQGMLHIPKGRFQNDQDMNRELHASQLGIRDVLESLGLETVKFDDAYFDLTSYLIALLVSSTNRRHRYESSFQAKMKVHKNWKKAIIDIYQESIEMDIVNDPYFLESIGEYAATAKNILEHTNFLFKKEGLDIFTFFPEGGKLDRFNLKYDVWRQPFLRIHDMLFCPMTFIADNDWIFTFPQHCMQMLKTGANKGEQDLSTKRMENFLAETLNKNGFKAVTFTQEDEESIEGDADIIIENEQTSLLIQLKRTYFRLNLRDQYFESVTVDKKAIQQLTDAEAFFNRPNKYYCLKRKVEKWIVTTSFEQIGQVFDGCKKVNYFDLLTAVRFKEINGLSKLIDYINKDRAIMDWKKAAKSISKEDTEVRKFLSEIGFPIDYESCQSQFIPVCPAILY